MPTFNDALDNLVTILRDYPPLVEFGQDKWGKEFTVKRRFQKKTELGTSEMPVILIIRPEVVKDFQLQARDGTHTVLLFVGFLQDDRELAQAELVELEEILDDAVLANYTLGDTVLSAMPGPSTNESEHPKYWLIMQVDVLHRR